MKRMSRWTLGAAAAACCAACTASKPQPQAAGVRVFKTDTVKQAGEKPAGLQATVVWPAVKELDPLEIAAMADPLIDLDPEWGSYRGIAQQSTESDGHVIRENQLSVSLTSLESIAPLRKFCEEHYPGAIILVHCDADNAFLLDSEQILHKYSSNEDR